jgi:RNA polymerase sigma-70 factor (ECF subfamily)
VSELTGDLEGRIRAACAAQDWKGAAATALAGYGEEILGYLVASLRNASEADDAFSLFCEGMWKSLPQFAWKSTFRTWAYTVARHAGSRIRRDPHRHRTVPLDDAELELIAARVRTQTPTFLQTEMRDRVAKLRAELEPDDQTLLILRLSRGLTWREVARVLADEEDLSTAALDAQATTLRKRFERLKTELKSRARALDEP